MHTLKPAARRAAGAVMFDGAFRLFGGFGIRGTVQPDDIGADLWAYKSEEWTLLTADAAPGSRYPSLLELDGQLWRFGGCGWDGEDITFENRVWVLDDTKLRWT